MSTGKLKKPRSKPSSDSKSKPQSKLEWQYRAEQRLKKLIPVLQSFPELKKMGTPRQKSAEWKVSIQLVNGPEMTELNFQYRGKSYPTDVLSFPTFPPFRDQGVLGDLVICLPTLKSQARSLGHTSELELDVLLIHGMLHLIGFDHEKSAQEALQMARWESKLLSKILSKKQFEGLPKGFGLIDRSKSGNEPG